MAFIKWDEVFVSNEGGKKEARYYLIRNDGVSVLAIIGKEKSWRHMAYEVVIRDKELVGVSVNLCVVKPRSRREVIAWLNSVISGLDIQPHHGPASGYLEDGQLQNTTKYASEILWLGSAVVCRKKRKHYQSFQRNSVKISVHDFVFVLAEEDKRLVAYLDDMYQDSKGNKMVVVRWFHKMDEIGIPLPQNYSGREILFSLCLQDINIECIDGLATVLSPQHYEKFSKEAAHFQLEPFVCHRLFDNDVVKPFDITQVKGYAEQELVKLLFTLSPLITQVKSKPDNDDLKVEINCIDAVELRPRKRVRHSTESLMYMPSASSSEASDVYPEFPDSIGCSVISNSGSQTYVPKDGYSSVSLTVKEEILHTHMHPLTVGAQVEVLSQDSGIRGCWFRALIIKKSKDKVKVQYKDIKDATDEVKHLEEWISTVRIASHDKWGLWSCGRKTIRPAQLFGKKSAAWVVNNGSVVDVWWHDCWWEGIVIRKGSVDKYHVYFPAEKKIGIFPLKDLRPSQEWLGVGWIQIKERPEVAALIVSSLEERLNVGASYVVKSPPHLALNYDKHDDDEHVSYVHEDSLLSSDRGKVTSMVRILEEDYLLAQLKWKSSRKRRSVKNSPHKLYDSDNMNKHDAKVFGTRTWEKYFIPSSSKGNHDNCTYTMDSAFSSSVVSPLTSLVLSR